LGQTRWRSYNLSQSVNGLSYVGQISQYTPHYTKSTEIKNPPPTGLIVFLDVHEDEIIDTMFGIPTELDWYYDGYWFDIPAIGTIRGATCLLPTVTLNIGSGKRQKWSLSRAARCNPSRPMNGTITTGWKPAFAKTSINTC